MKKLSSVVVTAAVLASSAEAFASAQSINTQFFIPSSSFDYVLSEDAMLSKRTGWGFGLTYNYENDPLVRVNSAGTDETGTIISDLHTLDLLAEYRFSRWELALQLPLHMVTPEAQSGQFALGDTETFAKYRLTDEDAPTAVALIADLRLPSGNGTYYLSDRSFSPGFRVAIEHDFKVLKLVGNAGFMYAYNSNVASEDISYRRRIPLSLSAMVPIGPRWAINAEGGGAIPLPLNSNQNPGEGYLGVRYAWRESVVAFAGGGVGNLNGVGSDDYRLAAGLRFALDGEPKKEVAPEPAPKPAPVVAPAPAPQPKKTPPLVIFTAKEIKLPGEVKFETAKDVLTASGRELLDEVARVIKENDKSYRKIKIEGHTDRHGGVQYNQKLSEARAAAVKEYLGSRGVDKNRLETAGYGKSRPKVVKGLSPVQQDAVNRRVEFKVLH